jgi:hypothetical protein
MTKSVGDVHQTQIKYLGTTFAFFTDIAPISFFGSPFTFLIFLLAIVSLLRYLNTKVFFVAQPAALARSPHRCVDQSSKILFCQIFLQIISNDLYTIAFTICGDKSVGVYLRPRSACKFVCSCPCSSQLPSVTIASLFSLGGKMGAVWHYSFANANLLSIVLTWLLSRIYQRHS